MTTLSVTYGTKICKGKDGMISKSEVKFSIVSEIDFIFKYFFSAVVKMDAILKYFNNVTKCI